MESKVLFKNVQLEPLECIAAGTKEFEGRFMGRDWTPALVKKEIECGDGKTREDSKLIVRLLVENCNMQFGDENTTCAEAIVIMVNDMESPQQLLPYVSSAAECIEAYRGWNSARLNDKGVMCAFQVKVVKVTRRV